MNKNRRKEIALAISDVQALREQFEAIICVIEDLRDEEQEYYDNMPEGFQNSEPGERAQQAVDNLENAASSLDQIDFDEVIDSLGEASE